jgi:hypothetical protein
MKVKMRVEAPRFSQDQDGTLAGEKVKTRRKFKGRLT